MTAERLLLAVLDRGVQLWADDHDLCFKAPKGALTPTLRKRLGERKAEIVGLLAAGMRYAPASFDQRRLWILDQLQPNGSAYSTTGAFRLLGRLDVPALEASLNEISHRHEVLRTTLTAIDGRPVQVIARATTIPLPRVDLSGLRPGSRSIRASELIAAQTRRAFDLGSGPLFRALLLRLDRREWILFLRLHHAISDGWSEAILHRELSAHYANFSRRRPSRQAELPEQYADFAAWQRQQLSEETLDHLLDYWHGQLEGLEPIHLPADRPRPDRMGFVGAAHHLHFDSEVSAAVTRLARDAGASAYMTLLAAFMALLHRLTGQQGFAIGSPMTHRKREELEGLIGLFVNMLVIRADLSAAGDLRFAQLLERVRETTLQAYAHQNMPFDRLVAELAPDRDLSRHPLFQVSFALHSAPKAPITLSGLDVSSERLEISTVQLDLEFHLWQTGAGLSGYLVYSSDLFDGATVARWANHFGVLLRAAACEPWHRIQDLSLHSRTQRHQLLTEWNDTRERYPSGEGLHQLFESQAARTPDREAVAWLAGGRCATLSYRQLANQADRLARRLRGLGVGPETRVAIFLGRGPAQVVAMLGILKAGGAYLPLDPEYPARRLAYLVEDSRAAVIVTSDAGHLKLPQHRARVVCLQPGGTLPRHGDAGGVAQARGQGLSEVESRNTAYVLYTSGSTGQPKATEITHAAICNHMHWMQAALPLGRRDRVLQKTPFSFDASVWEFWAPLQVGATLVLSSPGSHRDPPALIDLARIHRVTILQVVPALLRVLLEEPSWNRCLDLRRVLCGGEALSRDLRDRFVANSAGGELYNVYGPTEATIHATFHACAPKMAARAGATVAVGRPIANARALVVDRWLRPVAPGAAGELMVGGAGLARGYLDRPGLTAERFVPDPLGDQTASRLGGERLYRTGDLVRHLPDGALAFIDRTDQQIKIRGYRIEPGEIEALLLRHPVVRAAAVVMWIGAGSGLDRRAPREGARLVAFVVTRSRGEHAAPEPASTLRAFLAERLAIHMLPAAIVPLDALPLSTAGKVDRDALARRILPAFERKNPTESYEPPRTPIEELVAAIWAPLLGIDRIGVRDNFFERGGHSLLAIQALSRIRRSFGVAIAVRTMFERPTVAGLAASLEQARREQTLEIGRARPGLEAPPIVGVSREDEIPLSFPQRGLWFLNQLEPEGTAYHAPAAFHLTGRLHLAALETSLCEIVRRHEVLRTTFSSDGGRPRQQIRSAPAEMLSLIDVSGLAPGRRRDTMRKLVSREASGAFDLSRGPLFRAHLLRLAEDEHVLLLSIHHIAFDGWSHGVLCRELGVLYACSTKGERSPLPELAVQYADFAVWQRRWLTGVALEQRLGYWRQQLAALPLLDLSGGGERPNGRSSRGAARELKLEPELLIAVNRLAVEQGASLYMALLAGFILLLYRLTGQRDVTVGSPVANRGHEDIESLIGFFVNMLPLRVGIAADEDCSFARLLSVVRETALGAYAHQDLPFELLVEALAPDRGRDRHPLFQVTFALHNAPGNELDLPGLAVRRIPVDTQGVRLDLELHFWQARPDTGALKGRFVYDTHLFDAKTIDRWSSHYIDLLRIAIAEPERAIPWLPLETGAGRHRPIAEKEDRRAGFAVGVPRVDPRTPAEQALVEIWAQVLGMERLGVEDNFFQLGGHSLLATRVIAQARQVFELELPLRVLFERPTIAGLAEWLAEAPAMPARLVAPPITAASRDREPRLSFAQQRLWFLQQLAPESPAYNMFDAQRIAGRLDVTALTRALGEIVRRHQVLRTVFPSSDGHPSQRAMPATSFRLPRIDLSRLRREHRLEVARRRLSAEAARPFDLARELPLRALLMRFDREDHVLFLNRHHIVYDGWSHGIFSRELSRLYPFVSDNAQPLSAAPLAGMPLQYADFAAWQRQWLRGDALAAQLDYWRRQLTGLNVLELPADRRPTDRTFSGSSLALRISPALTAALKTLGVKAGVSLFMLLLASFMTLLHRLTGHSDIAVGTPIANRQRREIEDLIGFFVNTLVLRGDLSANPSFLDVLRRVREVALRAYAHQDLPFEKLVEELGPRRDLSHSPLFRVMFALQNAPSGTDILPGLRVSSLELESATSLFDLNLSMAETEGGLGGWLRYPTDLFDRTTIQRLAGHFQTLLASVAARPALDLRSLQVLTAGEQHQLLYEWQGARGAVESGWTVVKGFEQWVAATPETLAVHYGSVDLPNQYLSYWELNSRANRLAVHLRQLGVTGGQLVGLSVERSLEMTVGLLGILKAGAAFVPLDPTYPEARLALILQETEAPIILTQAALRAKLRRLSGELRAEVFCLDEDWPRVESVSRDEPRGPDPLDLAYVIYTSGSTGRPKGVVMIHRAVANLISWHVRELLSGVRTLQFASLSFDGSFHEIFAAWCSGGGLFLVNETQRRDPAGLAALLAAAAIEKAKPPVLVLQRLAEEAGSRDLTLHLREITIGGERLQITPEIVELFERQGEARLHNHYGTTETHAMAAYPLPGPPAAWPARPPVGRPIDGSTVHLLSPSPPAGMEPVPAGATGEIHIGGIQVGPGYWHRPRQTAERFLPDPVARTFGARRYRTGDLGRYLPDGTLEYLERLDHQIKIRGFRVEPGEIEAVLGQHPAVKEAAVVIHGADAEEGGPGNARLICYLVVGGGGPLPAFRDVRVFLGEQLPDYMVPHLFVELDALPLSPTGKIDRADLARRPLPETRQSLAPGTDITLPRTPSEEILVTIWEHVLSIQPIDIFDHFFELGGHSLLATQVVSRVRTAFEVELPLRMLFEQPTIEELARWVDAARHREDQNAGTLPPIRSRVFAGMPSSELLPLSFAQRRLWFLQQLAPESPIYNMAEARRLEGRLDVAALVSALETIVGRHEVLRTRFPSASGHPRQQIVSAAPFLLPRIDLSGLPPDQRRREGRRLLASEAMRPYQLARELPLRVRLVRLAADDHLLFLSIHHIVSDGWSRGIFYRELSALYRWYAEGQEQASPLPELEIQYADFALWQRDGLSSAGASGQRRAGTFQTQLTYWRRQLVRLPALELPLDHPRPIRRTYRGGAVTLPLSTRLRSSLKRLSLEAGASLYMTLLAAFMVLLHRLTGQDDVVVGTTIANRHRQEVEGLIGFFANTLVLRGDLSPAGQLSVHGLLARVKKLCLDAYDHQDMPFEKLVEEIEPDRDPSLNPLFQTFFLLHEQAAGGLELPGLISTPEPLGSISPMFDLMLVMEDADGLTARLAFDADLFESSTIERWAECFNTLLASMVSTPKSAVGELELLSATAVHHLLAVREKTTADYPSKTIHRLFEEQAARTPDRRAVTCGVQALTYRQLDTRANRLAHHLRDRGVATETLVAVYLERSTELIVTLLAILKAGGAYLPLDPVYPAERRRFIVRDARATHLVTHRGLEDEMLEEIECPIFLDADREIIARCPAEAPASGARAHHLAYCLYTSGSTGRPKGVLVEHRNVVRLLINDTAVSDRGPFSFGRDDVWTMFHSCSFDFSVWEMYGALLHGGRLVIVPATVTLDPLLFLDLLVEQGVTVLNQTPSAFYLLAREVLEHPGVELDLHCVIFGGEALDPMQLAAWHDAFPGVRLVNMYGITETTVHVTFKEITHEIIERNTANIGVPMPTTTAYIMDPRLRLAPVGAPGEICVGGEGVARGYLRRGDLTARRFVADPYRPGERLYRSGDLARLLPSGEMLYLGRLDEQIQIRGFRVEPGEIRARLSSHPSVAEAAVITQPTTAGGIEIVAYIVVADDFDAKVLREHLEGTLPSYMMPAAVVEVPALPRSPSGKINLRGLPAPELRRPDPEATFTAPRSPIEDVLAEIWRQLLGLDKLSVHDNFFELGGHSLLATQVMSRIRRAFDVRLALRVLFEQPTIARLATNLEKTLESGIGLVAPPITPADRDHELPLSFAQQRLWFLHRFEPTSPIYNMPVARRLEGQLDVAALGQALAEIVRRHEVLRTIFPDIDGRPRQQIEPAGAFRLPLIDLTVLQDANLRWRETRQRMSAEAARPFDLARQLPLRVLLVRLASDDHILFLNLHHIVSDGWSVGVFNRELSQLYRAFLTAGPHAAYDDRPSEHAPLPELPIQYADFAVWQRMWLRGDVLEAQLAFWRRQLASPTQLELPTDRPRPMVQTSSAGAHYLSLGPRLSDALEQSSLEAGASLFMTMLAAYMALLHRYTGQTDIVVGSPIANRGAEEIEGLIGFFVNMLVLRGDLSGGSRGSPDFKALVRRIREVALEAYAQQDLPFEKLVEALDPERDMSQNPLFQVTLTLENTPGPEIDLPGLEMSLSALSARNVRFDLELYVWQAERLEIGLLYNTDLFDAVTIIRMAAHFKGLLAAAVADPLHPIATLPYLPSAERHQILAEWNGGPSRAISPELAHQLIETWAQRAPEALAIIHEAALAGHDQQVTYSELNRRANQLAHHLLACAPCCSARGETRVGIYLERSIDAAIAVLGVLKAGATYVPVDAAYGMERLSVQLCDAGASTLVTRRTLLEKLPEPLRPTQVATVCLSEDWAAISRRSGDNPHPGARKPARLAYIGYTSGSTGRPKGAMISHRGLVNAYQAWERTYRLDRHDRHLQMASLSFDVFSGDLMRALGAGGTLVLCSRELLLDSEQLSGLMRRQRVTCAEFVPTVAHELARHLNRIHSPRSRAPLSFMRLLVVGSDSWSLEELRALAELAGTDTRLINSYGVTEATIDSLSFERTTLELANDRSVPVGRPFDNTQGLVLDRQLSPVPATVAGELHIAGCGLSRGYANSPRRTALKLVPHPFATAGEEPGGRLYKTGDRARFLPDGNLELLGRIDRQTKIRGFRIEPGEIEMVLGQHCQVGEAAVVLVPETMAAGGGDRLVACVIQQAVTGINQSPESLVPSLRKYLQERLPSYMRPAAFVIFDQMPLLPSGKIDRAALAREAAERTASERDRLERIESPRTPTEKNLVEIWRELLGVDHIGVREGFFCLGGHSLLAVRLLSRIEQRLGVRLTLPSFFQEPTVRGLAGRVAEQGGP